MSDAQDATVALAKLTALLGVAPEPGRLLVFTFPGEPVPKARPRPRMGKQGGYFVPTHAAQEALAWAFVEARGRRARYVDSVAVVALFYVATRQRKDLDNCLKLVLDAGNAARVWVDDVDVRGISTWIELDPTNPRTVVAVAPCVNSLTRMPLIAAAG